MRKRLLAGALFSVILLSASTVLAADNWIGTWKLNVAKSKYGAGQAPKSQTLKWEAKPTASCSRTRA